MRLPPEEQVTVWYRRTDQLNVQELDAFDAILSDDERVRRDRFFLARDRRDFSAAHALVRTVLSGYDAVAPGEWRFEARPHGKPAIAASQAGMPPLHFNISHTHGVVACAVARGSAVGVDVECCTRAVGAMEIASRFFAPRELEMLQAARPDDRQVRFIELWTLKESYVKATGAGLSLALQSFAFSFAGTSMLRFVAPEGAAPAQFWLAALSADVRLAVAVIPWTRGRDWRVSFHDADEAGGPPAVLLRRCG